MSPRGATDRQSRGAASAAAGLSPEDAAWLKALAACARRSWGGACSVPRVPRREAGKQEMQARLRASLNSSGGCDCSDRLFVPAISLHGFELSRVSFAGVVFRSCVASVAPRDLSARQSRQSAWNDFLCPTRLLPRCDHGGVPCRGCSGSCDPASDAGGWAPCRLAVGRTVLRHEAANRQSALSENAGREYSNSGTVVRRRE